MPRKPKQSSPATVVQEIQDWSDSDLEQLRAMIDSLLEARLEPEEAETTDPIDEQTGLHGGRGHIELKMIPDSKGSGQVYGPYKYLRYRQGKTLKSVYLGKANGSADSNHINKPSSSKE